MPRPERADMGTVSNMAEHRRRSSTLGHERATQRYSGPARRLVAVAFVVLAACSGSDDSAPESSDGPAPTTTVDPDSLFDPSNPEGTAPPVPGTAVELDDDVIIATDDGQIPTTTTEPPIDPDGPDAPPAPAATTTTVAPVPLPAPSDIGRIVSVSPTHTETLFALGLGEFVVGVDPDSDFPDAAVALQQSNLAPDSADLGPLLALDPDIVIIGDDPTGLAQRLSAEGVASFSGPPAESLEDVYEQILGIANVVGRPDLGEDLVDGMRQSIEATIASLPDTSERVYFHEIDPSLFTITPGTFLDSVYGEMGLVSFMPADPSGFAQASNDRVLSADPAVVMLADVECCAVNADTVALRPGWSTLSAVRNGAVVELSDHMVQRWGPRVVELVEAVAAGVASAG